MKNCLPHAILVSFAVCIGMTACAVGPGSDANPTHRAGAASPTLAHWVKFKHIPAVLDLARRGADGSMFVAAAGRLFTLRPGGALTPYARGPGGYRTARGPEPYIAVTGSQRVAGTRCSFGTGTIFALEPGKHPGIIRVRTDGRASRFASVPATGLLTGIAFDGVGHFGHRLLATFRSPSGVTTVLAFDCARRVRTITSKAPALEGGLAVAPASFGRFGGDLIAPNERDGRVYAVRPDGTVLTLAASGLPRGGDIGVESAGFVPPGFGPSDGAYLADRRVPRNRHPGDDSMLRLPGSALIKSGARAGDLLVATEASAKTVLIRCAATCTVKYIAIGPAVAHAEGHIIFAP
jgi:hypothetical protein